MTSVRIPSTSLPSSQLRLLTKVAQMYHERGVRQAQIADSLHLSQARVSRLLKRAASEGIVRTVVVSVPGLHTDLEDVLEQRYGLLDALVVDVEGGQQETVGGIASAAAGYLEETLGAHERIGISSWSDTLLTTTARMRTARSPSAESVVQLVGDLGTGAAQAKASGLLTDLCAVIGARPTFLPAPGLVGSASTRDSLMADPAIDSVVRHWTRLTTALLGIGNLSPSPLLLESGNAITPQEQEQLLTAGAVGDVCCRFFDSAGRHVPTGLDHRVIGIDPRTLRAVPRRVGIAGGAGKHVAVRAALTGRWVNVLITDVATARVLTGDAGSPR
jgi:DNA-binding transcriptional regulator LsrR (DeoR family)